MDDAITAARTAFVSLARDEVECPQPWELNVDDSGGQVHVKGAVLPGLGHFAIKAACGFPANARRGLPTTDGFTAVFDSESGFLSALLLDGGYLTDLRTGAAAAVVLDLVGPRNVGTIAFIGAGAQMKYQIDAALRVRTPERIIVRARSLEKAKALAAWARGRYRLRADAQQHQLHDTIDCDAIVTATNARDPVIGIDQVTPGIHITAIGSDSSGKKEIDPALLIGAEAIFTDSIEQSLTVGELQGIALDTLACEPRLIGEGLANGFQRTGTAPTVADITGTGAHDTAIAHIALLRLDGFRSGLPG